MMLPLVPVRELAEQIRGVTYTKGEASVTFSPGLVPTLRAGNINDEGLDLSDLIFVPESRVSPKQRIRRNDILIAASSGSLDVVGKAAQARKDFQGAFGAFCKVLRPNSRVDPRYFAHYFRTPAYRAKISSLAAGANINNLRNEHLDDLQIPLPPMEAQRRIAEVLDRADELRAKRREALAHLDNLTQSIFLDLLGDPVANPKGWPITTVGEHLILQQYGPRFYNEAYSKDGVPIARITDLDPHGNLNFSSMPKMDITEDVRRKFALKPGDLIFARTGATVGKLALIREGDPECIAGAYFIRMRFDSDILPEYAATLLRTKSVQAIVWAGSQQSAQQNFSGPGLRSLPLPIPPIDAQQEFARKVAGVNLLKQSHQASVVELDALFASLQNRAFKGLL